MASLERQNDFSLFFNIVDKDIMTNREQKYLPIIKIFREIGLPEPTRVKYHTKSLTQKESNLKGWDDKKLLEAILPKNRHSRSYQVSVYLGDFEQYCISIKQQYITEIYLEIPELNGDDLILQKIEHAFSKIILLQNWYFACQSFVYQDYLVSEKYLKLEDCRNSPFLYFKWKQFLSSEIIEKEGGFEVFENNPLLKCERMHNGLLVQVGESPYDIFTPEGEELMVKATLSLPPLK